VWSLLIVLSTPSDEISFLELFFLFRSSLRYFFFYVFFVRRSQVASHLWLLIFLDLLTLSCVSYLESANESYFTLYFLGRPRTRWSGLCPKTMLSNDNEGLNLPLPLCALATLSSAKPGSNTAKHPSTLTPCLGDPYSIACSLVRDINFAFKHVPSPPFCHCFRSYCLNSRLNHLILLSLYDNSIVF